LVRAAAGRAGSAGLGAGAAAAAACGRQPARAFALQLPVLVAAFVFAPQAGPAAEGGVALPGDGAGDHVVEEAPVVADQEDRAGVACSRSSSRSSVSMSRSLVGSSSTSTLAGKREQPRQQHAVALAARQRAHRRVGAFGREQEVAQVAHHVLARDLGLLISIHSLPGLMVSASVASRFSAARIWSK
jgi:hypothetical protein